MYFRFFSIWIPFLFLFGCAQSFQETSGFDIVNQPFIKISEPSTDHLPIIENDSTSHTSISALPEIFENQSAQNGSSENASFLPPSFTNKTRVEYYYSPLCPFYTIIKPHIEQMKEKYENDTEWYFFNVLDSKGLEVYNQMAVRFNLSASERVVPLVVINATWLSDVYRINASLESLIVNETNGS